MSDLIRGALNDTARPSSSRRSGCTGCIGYPLLALLAGLGLIVAAGVLLAWNEMRSAGASGALTEAAANVRAIQADRIDSANDGQLVHLEGMATTSETVHDPDLGVSAPAIALRRTAEMYQWQEHSSLNKVNGRWITTYSYEKVWSELLLDSRGFHNTSYNNPDSMPYATETWTAQTVTLGAYQVSASLVKQMGNFQPLLVEQVTGGIDRKIQLWEGGVYVGNNPASPEIGDLRLHYDRVTPTTVSVISRAAGRTFEPYHAKAGGTIDMLVVGEHSASEMLAAAQGENAGVTWFLRGLGALMLLLGGAAVIIAVGWIFFMFFW